MQAVSDGGYPIRPYADKVSSDDVGLGSVIHRDSVSVETNDVALSRDGAADRVAISARNLDAEEVIALCGTGSRSGLCPIADTADAIGGNADKVALDFISGRGRGEGPSDVNATDGVPGKNIPVCRRRRAYNIVRGVLDQDAVAAVGERSIGHPDFPGGIRAAEVAGNSVAITLDDDARYRRRD